MSDMLIVGFLKKLEHTKRTGFPLPTLYYNSEVKGRIFLQFHTHIVSETKYCS